MIEIGPCSECGAPLAGDQRYCVNCGKRLVNTFPIHIAPLEVSRQRSRLAGMPFSPQMASTLAAGALGFGVVIGTAISPGLSGIVAASLPPVAAPAISAPIASAPPVSSGGGGGSASVPTSSPSVLGSSSGSSGASNSGGGGGGHKKKKEQAMLTGTVVHANSTASSYALAQGDGGPLTAIHSAQLPQVGALVQVGTRQLANHTFAEQGKRKQIGSSTMATFTGTVTYRDAATGLYTVSSRGSSVLVHIPLAPTPTGTAPASDPPPLGASVQVSATITPPPAPDVAPPVTPAAVVTPNPACDPSAQPTPPVPPASYLAQTLVTVTSQITGPTDIEGIVRGTCSSPNLLVVSADDAGESGRSMVLSAPPTIDLSRAVVGQAIDLSATLADPGPYTLNGFSSDQGRAGADDASTVQGSN